MKFLGNIFFLAEGKVGGRVVGAVHGPGFQAFDCSSLKILVFCFW
jgi:hypothetical protein